MMKMTSSSRHRNRFTRQPVKSLYARKRDYDILMALYEAGMLTTSQIGTLFFGSHKRACVRLRDLFDADWVDRIFRPVVVGSAEVVYILGKEGVQRLAKESSIDKREINEVRMRFQEPKSLFLDHYLEINQFRIALWVAARSKGYKLLEWKYETDLKIKVEGELPRAVKVKDPDKTGRLIPVVPDGFFGLETPDGKSHHFFLEVDRGTMEPARFRRKMTGYARYRVERIYKWHLGIPGFRVLTVTNRSPSLLDAASQLRPEHFQSMFYFTDMGKITPENLFTTIWSTALDSSMSIP